MSNRPSVRTLLLKSWLVSFVLLLTVTGMVIGSTPHYGSDLFVPFIDRWSVTKVAVPLALSLQAGWMVITGLWYVWKVRRGEGDIA